MVMEGCVREREREGGGRREGEGKRVGRGRERDVAYVLHGGLTECKGGN